MEKRAYWSVVWLCAITISLRVDDLLTGVFRLQYYASIHPVVRNGLDVAVLGVAADFFINSFERR